MAQEPCVPLEKINYRTPFASLAHDMWTRQEHADGERHGRRWQDGVTPVQRSRVVQKPLAKARRRARGDGSLLEDTKCHAKLTIG